MIFKGNTNYQKKIGGAGDQTVTTSGGKNSQLL